MRRISAEIDKKIQPIRIHLDSLRKILDRFVEFQSSGDKPGSIALKTRDYEFNSLEELKGGLTSVGVSQIHSLDLTAYRYNRNGDGERISLYMSGGDCYIVSSKSDLLSMAVVEAVYQELQANRHPLCYFAHLGKVLGLILIGGALSMTACVVFKNHSTAILLVYMVFTIFPISAMMYMLNHHSTIVLSYKSDEPSFWKRNKDTLIVGVIMALIGAALAAAVTWYFTAPPSPTSHK